MSASPEALALTERYARSLEQVIVDQDQRLRAVQDRIDTLVAADTFDDAAAQALSNDQVELAVSALDSDITTTLASYLRPRDVHTRLALCCRYVDMLACANRIRNLAKALGVRNATPFLDSLPTLEEWLLSQRSQGASEDDLRLRLADYQHRIKLLQRRYKGVPGLHQLLGARLKEAATIREKVQTASKSIAVVRDRLAQLVNTKNSVSSRFKPLFEQTAESQRTAEQISERIVSIRKTLQQNSEKSKYYDMLKSNLEKAIRIFDRFQDVHQQWQMTRAQSTSCIMTKLRQLKEFSDELARTKENLNKMVTAGTSFTAMESNGNARQTAMDAGLLLQRINQAKEANSKCKQQKVQVSGELWQEMDRLRLGHNKLIDSAERYVEYFRAIRSKLGPHWSQYATSLEE